MQTFDKIQVWQERGKVYVRDAWGAKAYDKKMCIATHAGLAVPGKVIKLSILDVQGDTQEAKVMHLRRLITN